MASSRFACAKLSSGCDERESSRRFRCLSLRRGERKLNGAWRDRASKRRAVAWARANPISRRQRVSAEEKKTKPVWPPRGEDRASNNGRRDADLSRFAADLCRSVRFLRDHVSRLAVIRGKRAPRLASPRSLLSLSPSDRGDRTPAGIAAWKHEEGWAWPLWLAARRRAWPGHRPCWSSFSRRSTFRGPRSSDRCSRMVRMVSKLCIPIH